MPSSKAVWDEAYRRAKNHLKLGLVQSGMNPTIAAKVDTHAQVLELLDEDNCAYIKAAFAKLHVEED